MERVRSGSATVWLLKIVAPPRLAGSFLTRKVDAVQIALLVWIARDGAEAFLAENPSLGECEWQLEEVTFSELKELISQMQENAPGRMVLEVK